MAESLIYVLEDLSKDVAGIMLGIFTDLFGIDVYLRKVKDGGDQDMYVRMYGRHAGKLSPELLEDAELKRILLVQENFDMTSYSLNDVGPYSNVVVFASEDIGLPINSEFSVVRLDNKELKFKVDTVQTIGTVEQIYFKYKVKYMEL